MLTTIQGRMVLIFLGFVMLLGGVVGASFLVLGQQKDDGLVINLAGRQRMLTQKMTKEALALAVASSSAGEASIDAARDDLRQTMRVFGATLDALRKGGPAPLNLEMSQVREVPAASSEEIAKKLASVDALWVPFKKHMEGVISSKGTNVSDLSAVRQANLKLLGEMNAAVGLMQSESEGKVGTLYVVQGVALALGLCLVALGGWLARTTIAAPIAELAEAARVMSMGNLSVQFRAHGAREVRDLGESFDRMRASMIAITDGGLAEQGAGADDF